MTFIFYGPLFWGLGGLGWGARVTHMDNLVLHMENVQARSAPVTES